MTQQEFADRIGIKRNTVAMYEIGRNIPMDNVITSIHREFQVNETWLRTGAGEMKAQTTLHEELTAIFAGVLKTAPDKRAMMVGALASVPPEVWDTIADQVEAFVAKHRDEWEAKYGKKG
jgi:transcriptional regulator with XRE-family HTH domain